MPLAFFVAWRDLQAGPVRFRGSVARLTLVRKTWFPTQDMVVLSARTTTCSGVTTETEDHDSMRCPACGDRDTRVVDSRDLDDSATIRRRRECGACATRFTTYERIEAARLVVVKRDGTRQEWDRDKMAAGLRKALTRRPVPDGAADEAADAIEAQLRSEGMTEVPSSKIGSLAMAQLRALDHIAYIRFASVYQSFEDLEALKREVDSLYDQKGSRGPNR
jgi:transcriptional repressor NrdR